MANSTYVLPTGNTDIKFSQVITMFGSGSAPGLSDYKKGGTYVDNTSYNTKYIRTIIK
jgi:hypothetical protein